MKKAIINAHVRAERLDRDEELHDEVGRSNVVLVNYPCAETAVQAYHTHTHTHTHCYN
jgi:hypothetical protein